jgi:ribosomal-protein-serine acetyltransferase
MFRRAVTSDIEIRLFQPDDAEATFAVVERNRAYLREWLPWVDRTDSPADVLNFIETVAIPQYEANKGPNCGVWKSGEFLGSIGCHDIEWLNRNCSMGYWLDAAHQGQGIVTQCCVSFLEYLFDELGLHRVVIECGVLNARSCAIPRRLGFTREGIKREAQWVNGRWLDLVTWSLLEHEWRDLANSRPKPLPDSKSSPADTT